MEALHSASLYESQPVCGETQAHSLLGVAVNILNSDLGIYMWHYTFDLISCHSSLSRNTISSLAFPAVLAPPPPLSLRYNVRLSTCSTSDRHARGNMETETPPLQDYVDNMLC
jgi:hypothetical protein